MTKISDTDVKKVLEGVPLEFRKYKSKWSETYQSKFQDVINDVNQETIESICTYANINYENNDHVTKLRTDTDKYIFLFSLYRFLNDKKLAVQEMAEKQGETLPDNLEYKYVIDQLNNGNPAFLYHIFLYAMWLDEKDKSRYAVQNDLPTDYANRFETNSRGIRMTLSRNTRAENFNYSKRNKIQFGDSTLFAISRQASDVEKADVTGPQRRRDLRYVFLEVYEPDKILTISTRSKGIRSTLKEKIEEEFSVLTMEADIVNEETEISRSQFEEEVKKHKVDDSDEVKLLSIDFRDTNIQPSLPISVSKKSVGKEIRPVVAHLGEEIVDIDLLNIKKFWFSYLGIETKVKVEENIDKSFLRLNADINTRSEVRSRELIQKFEEEFGIPLNKKIPLYWITRVRKDLISQMLKGMGYWQTKYIKDGALISSLTDELGILEKKDLERHQCKGCENFYKYSHPDGCPKCGNILEVIDTSFELQISEDGVRRYFKTKMEEEGLYYYEKKWEKIYGKEYPFYEIGTGSDVVRVLFNSADIKLTPGSTKYLRKSLQPVLVLNPGDVIDKSLIEEVTSGVLDLSDMVERDLFGTLPDRHISQKVASVARNVEKRASASAVDSFNNIQRVLDDPSNHRGEEFEQDIFHILNQIVPTLQQWGAKRRGNQPDGFGELAFTKGGNQYYRSFAFDGKFTSDDELNMPTKEANTLSDYALRIYKSDEVQSSDTKFRNFIVITNSEPGNFGSVGAKKLNRMHSWQGVPVLMHSDFLLTLHVGFNENITEIKKDIHIFNEQLFLTLNGGKMFHRDIDKEFFVHLTKEDAVELFENLNEERTGSGLDISKLRLFLERDEIPV